MTAANSHAQVLAADSHEPKAHASTHESGGSDELDVTGLTGAGGGGGGGGTELDYVEFHATVSPTATSAATANTVVTGSAVAYDGSTAVWIEFFAPLAQPGDSGATMTFTLYDGSSAVGTIGALGRAGSGASYSVVNCRWRLTPSAATHTYSIRAWVSTGTGSIGSGDGTTGAAGFIRIATV